MNGSAKRNVAVRIACTAVALLFAFTCLAGLSGCKYTSVLTQQVEDEQQGDLDETANPIYRDTAGAPEDPARTSTAISDADRTDAQEQALPAYAPDAPENGQTDIREQRPDSANTDTATTGNQFSYAEGKNEVAGESDVKGESTAGEGEGEGESSTDASSTGDGEPGDLQNLAGGIGGSGETFDATGTDYELPEGVQTVATAGPYAVLVQMMAGRGALVAADAGLVEASDKLGVFPGEGVDDLPLAFEGDAELGYEADVDALIDLEPDAVLVDNALVKLDELQTAQLQAAGVNVVVLPQLGKPDTPDEDVVKAVNVVGELLAAAELQYDAQAMADGYEKLHDDLVEACLQANGGYSYKLEYGSSFPGIYQGTADSGTETTNLSSVRYVTAFIDSWTADVQPESIAIRRYGNATLYLDGELVDATEGAGLSATTSSRNFVLMDYYLQVAGATNNSYEGVKPMAGGSGSASDPYLVVPGGTRNLITDTTRVASRTTPSALWFPPSSTATASSWLKVGDAGFPRLLVRSQDIAQRVVASANKVNGLYNVGAPYEVRVVPTGVCGSWADGTVESFLLASWTECLFKDGGNLERCQSYVEQFYKTFYRCPASSALADFDSAFTALCTVG